ncbi:hypothetical protein HYH03_001862 [Edaphochlamys debaryana]|uniref:Peptidase M11 gametolysin domain-containing protein n=1 Tax=Edaphochlamys debaryana TaxID=47281 RepID=A0A835YM99_9CHLO|nr:hypothetical protein HYH03_001862 [Edaphochlamys debaryana]|eukprot:KAG2500284.1 hypothetical protein HYH03_001862 [Edaphochlamys debaryana]
MEADLSSCRVANQSAYVDATGQLRCIPAGLVSSLVGTVSVETSHFDNGTDGSTDFSAVFHVPVSDSNETLTVRAQLNLGDAADQADVSTGDKITFRVVGASGRRLLLSGDMIFCDESAGLCTDSSQATPNATTSGGKDFVVDGKPVNITGVFMLATSVCNTANTLRWNTFVNGMFNADQSKPATRATLQHFYAKCSWNTVQFLPSNVLLANVTLPCTGVYQTSTTGKVTYFNSQTSCGAPETDSWHRLGLAQAQTNLGITNAQMPFYKRRVLYLPYRSACPFNGLASIGCTDQCYATMNPYEGDRFQAALSFHELGHNIGLQHANRMTGPSSIQEYGDLTDVMGSNYVGSDTTFACPSAPTAFKAGWIKPLYNESLIRGSFPPGQPKLYTLPSMSLTNTNFLYINISWLPNFVPAFPWGAESVPLANQLFVSYRVRGPALAYDSALTTELSRKVYVHTYNTSYRNPPRVDPFDIKLWPALVSILDTKNGSVDRGRIPVDIAFRVNYGALRGSSSAVNGLHIAPVSLNATHATITVCYFTVLKESDGDNGCGNGADDDCDGLVDGADPDCGGSGATLAAPAAPATLTSATVPSSLATASVASPIAAAAAAAVAAPPSASSPAITAARAKPSSLASATLTSATVPSSLATASVASSIAAAAAAAVAAPPSASSPAITAARTKRSSLAPATLTSATVPSSLATASFASVATAIAAAAAAAVPSPPAAIAAAPSASSPAITAARAKPSFLAKASSPPAQPVQPTQPPSAPASKEPAQATTAAQKPASAPASAPKPGQAPAAAKKPAQTPAEASPAALAAAQASPAAAEPAAATA